MANSPSVPSATIDGISTFVPTLVRYAGNVHHFLSNIVQLCAHLVMDWLEIPNFVYQ